jgi:hypothetical protein
MEWFFSVSNPWLSRLSLKNNPQCKQRDNIEQHNADFIDSHTAIVKFIKRFQRKTKPPTMESIEPIVTKPKHAKPD